MLRARKCYCPEKEGGLHWKTTVEPWVAYTPEAWWVTRLWKAHKVEHCGYLSLSSRLRDGHARRKADVEAVLSLETGEVSVQVNPAGVRAFQRPLPLCCPLLVWVPQQARALQEALEGLQLVRSARAFPPGMHRHA